MFFSFWSFYTQWNCRSELFSGCISKQNDTALSREWKCVCFHIWCMNSQEYGWILYEFAQNHTQQVIDLFFPSYPSRVLWTASIREYRCSSPFMLKIRALTLQRRPQWWTCSGIRAPVGNVAVNGWKHGEVFFFSFFFFCLCLLFKCRSSWNLSIYLLLWWKWSEFPRWLTPWLVIKIFFFKICHQIKEIKWWKEYIKVKKTVVATNNVVHQEEEIFQLFLIHTEHLTVKNINLINISFICCCISPTWYKMDGFVDKKISFSV